MPLKIEEKSLIASGRRYLQIDASGEVGLEDGRGLEAWVLPGAPHHMGFLLSRVAKGTNYLPDVRKFFPTLDDKITATAVVVTSPIARAAINFMIRVGRRHSKIRLFTDEEEALTWLDGCARSNPLGR